MNEDESQTGKKDSSSVVEIRTMSLADIRQALRWAEGEGWNPGIDDAEPFLAADPSGSFMLRLDGKAAVSISAVSYGQFGFIGLYICRPDLRGHAMGARLVRVALDYLAGQTIGIDGVLSRVANYEKLGFRLSHRNLRFGGAVSPLKVPDRRIRLIDAALIPTLVAFDATMFGCSRRSFAERWLMPTATRSGLALEEDGEVAGYGVVRDCVVGHKIGPLFARSADDAGVILRSLAALRPGGVLFLDVPAPNVAGVALAKSHGMEVAFETARMYRGGDWKLPLDHTFGVTSFELG